MTNIEETQIPFNRKKNDILSRLYGFISDRRVYHSLFWLFFLLLLSLFSNNNMSYWKYVMYLGTTIGSFAALVYFNLFYLFPSFLVEKKFGRYMGLFFVSVFIITYVKIGLLMVIFHDDPSFLNLLKKDQIEHFLIVFTIGSLSTVLKIITDWVRHQRERNQLKTQTMQSELKFLRSQINPHFLFNTLNNLYALTLKKDDRAPEIVIKLSEMMRYMLYECNEKRVFLNKEVNYLRNYLDLERLRQNKDVDIDFVVNGHIHNQMIAPLMFIPFVENSFKHGLSNSLDKAFINIDLNVNDERIFLKVENSKSDTLKTPRHQNKKSGGIGLVNVKRRLNLLYPNQHELNIKNNPNSYIVELSINL